MAVDSYRQDLKWGVAVLLFAVLALSGALFAPWDCPVGGQDASDAAACQGYGAPGLENLETLSGLLLAEDGFVVALQVLGVALVAALIGALVMALRDKEGGAA